MVAGPSPSSVSRRLSPARRRSPFGAFRGFCWNAMRSWQTYTSSSSPSCRWLSAHVFLMSRASSFPDCGYDFPVTAVTVPLTTSHMTAACPTGFRRAVAPKSMSTPRTSFSTVPVSRPVGRSRTVSVAALVAMSAKVFQFVGRRPAHVSGPIVSELPLDEACWCYEKSAGKCRRASVRRVRLGKSVRAPPPTTRPFRRERAALPGPRSLREGQVALSGPS